jgi:hypothetical protein
MAGGYVQVDETPIDYLEPGYGRARQSHLWTDSHPYHDNHRLYKFCEFALPGLTFNFNKLTRL